MFLSSPLQCERIMKLSEMCRKLETEEEKVLPFYATSLTPEEEAEVAAQAEEPCSEELAKVKRDLLFWYNMTIFVQASSVYQTRPCG